MSFVTRSSTHKPTNINHLQEGATALHLASEKGHKETTQLLVSWAADVECGDKVLIVALLFIFLITATSVLVWSVVSLCNN